ncbi:YbfB/YjiJ family MFS transporter [Ciceribacter sp. L1K22]|uniref:YbfB/YjiJ family MFS transporter n=1 Tax=Ciceribacter sp. L1K22 TaxID=2820275 RepID=UPI001ABDA027|nr:YbfB/YjiJ family MFS transporter [Ciceribacter sp. L1K22]MBO3761167.1 MFS transporter [Ciceribacter sp. L1K22]
MIPRFSDIKLLPVAIAGGLALAAAMGFGRFAFTPILPGMIADLALSSAQAGLIAAGNFLGYLVGAVLAAYGWATGRERSVALLSLLLSTLALAAMAVVDSVAAFVVIRFVAGLASAFAMIFTSSIVLTYAAARANEHVQSIYFGGVGVGIAASSLMVFLISGAGHGDPSMWRIDWVVAAVVSLAMLVVVWAFLPYPPKIAGEAKPEPELVWGHPLILLTLSYGLFGFGYVITATFIVTMARLNEAGPLIEFLTWLLTGLTAAASIAAWRPVLARYGLARLYVAALLIEAVAVFASVSLDGVGAPLAGGIGLGATFVIVTAYGLRLGRVLAPESPRRALAFMTAAFGIGQIVGPIVAGWLAEATGGFTVASAVAATVLALSALIALPVCRAVR